ncbi:hypothetical protein DFJ74DRAFT_439050 [Hyaloraphidium curvatum]|nr:hypothetical protein DFJ74DRAFT_439050 [Hyaloraphidium curvatum]
MGKHVLAFLEPGHFHAALVLREPHPAVDERILVYAPEGPELRAFLDLVEAFNTRTDRPTAWKPDVRISGVAPDDALEQLVADRLADAVVLAGRNDRKAPWLRRLHAEGFHVLADKPWLTSADGISDVRSALAGGPVVFEMMTGRHAVSSKLTERLVGEPDVFGHFAPDAGPVIRLESVHHLEKTVNGAPLRRPPWYFDVRAQGNGVADIPTHLVDEAQRLLAGHGNHDDRKLDLLSARLWPTEVPLAAFRRVTGAPDFPPSVHREVAGGSLRYLCNSDLHFRLRGVEVETATRWELTQPQGGGDLHATTVRGTRSELRVVVSPKTGFRPRVLVVPLLEEERESVGSALRSAVESWGPDLKGVTVQHAPAGFEVVIPEGLDPGHEAHFPLVLDEFVRAVDGEPGRAERAAATLAKYELLAEALAATQ